MLQNWLKPPSASFLSKIKHLPENALGNRLLRQHDDTLPDLKKVKVALLGIDEKSANAVREQLYEMAWAFPENSIADLGNLRKAEPTLLIQVIYELLSGKVVPVILGQSDDLARAQFLAYQEAKALVNLAVIDQRLQEDVYAPILQPRRHPMLLHFSLIGHQMHQMPPAWNAFLQQHNFDTARLGRSRTAMEETEPLLRDADLLAFHLGAIRQSEAPATTHPSPSGYFTEEACQLCRYAGMSDKLTSFGLYGWSPDRDRDAQTARIAGQMVWYFLEGFFARKGDYPVSTAGLTEYVVDFRKLNFQITFWKSGKTGRWWMQVPSGSKRKHERHRLVPCSYQDYQLACRDELPERLMQALSRFD